MQLSGYKLCRSFILGVGIFLTSGLKLLLWLKTPGAFVTLWCSRDLQQQGDIIPFHALMTALSATIGTGNIADVATAIVLGKLDIIWLMVDVMNGNDGNTKFDCPHTSMFCGV